MANPAYFYYVIFRKDHERLTNQLKNGQMPQKGSFFPSKLDLRVTYRCNLSCKMCGQWGETGTYKDYSREKTNKGLKFETLKNIIEFLRRYAYPGILNGKKDGAFSRCSF